MAIFNSSTENKNGGNKKAPPAALKNIFTIMGLTEKKDIEFITRAYNLARKAHRGQKRFSGEPYLNHPIAAAEYLAKIGMGPTIIAATLLHDSIEDSDITADEIAEELSLDVRNLVEGVTKLGHVRYRGMKRHTESLRKLFAATSQDVRVMIIKLADRLHNASTLGHIPRDDKRERIAQETLEIYAPIADRLGMGLMKRELEDAVFPHAYPEEYEKVLKIFKEAGGDDIRRLERTHNTVRKKIAEYGVKKFRTANRVKGLYSLYRKLERKDWDITKIFDLWALRIIVDSVADCYTVLGIVHGEWRPLPGRVKDYIAFPKPNGYKGIHTTIHTGDGNVIELQIRTEEMHREAQFGIASHFSYKADGASKKKGDNSAVSWIRQFIPARLWMEGQGKLPSGESKLTYTDDSTPDWLKNMADAQDVDDENPHAFLQDIKSDFFSHRVFVFTPRGDVIDLPIDSSPIDFAYAIHSEIGNNMSGAKVNGKMAALSSCLKNGDVVEIETSEKNHPNRKWMDMAKTTLAKRHIRTYLQRVGEAI
ncbi:bifunctional (p)ppGpp synthetase/guanosine-3',5'-bis(diphosphate) 3'-pyrophosphohydrolase [Candidatus Kaiserbacteria bacterium]|nr:MAG: bifunctional (p)ppGpp synthetase/guanosine-3',5'-bis(diphosphate) 3'-pyrophosphohydrolase [Candidatus Kaiserbacteria bacterium]